MPFTLTVRKSVARELSRAEISRRLTSMMGALQLEKEEVSFLLTDDEQIQFLNKNYRGRDRPTDVLAFALSEGEFAAFRGPLLGDVIVSVPTAARQASKAKRPLLDELTMLLAHGLLHLLGWDHDTPARDRRMRAETERLCGAAAPPGRAVAARRPTHRASKKKAET